MERIGCSRQTGLGVHDDRNTHVALYWVEYFTADVVNPASAEFFSLFSFYWLLMYPGLVAIYWAFRFVFRKKEIER